MNKYVFNEEWKEESESKDFTERGRLFQIRGAALAKARSPKVFSLVLGTDKSKASVSRGA